MSLYASVFGLLILIYSQIYWYINGPSLPIGQQVYMCPDTYICTQSQGLILQPWHDWNLAGAGLRDADYMDIVEAGLSIIE